MKKINDDTVFNGFIKKKDITISKTKDVVCYTRVSSKDQMENNDSLRVQRNKIELFCRENGFSIIDYFGGTHESGKSDYTRGEFTRLLDYIKRRRKKPYGIVVYMISRFSRSGGGAIGILTELVEEHKVHLIEASSGQDTTTPRGFLYITEKLVDSRKENLVRQETVIPGMISFLAKGNSFGRSPIGYDHYGPRVKDGRFFSKDQRLVVNKQGEILKYGFQLKLSGNYSDVQIIDILKKRGLTISKQRISSIWRNPFYCGMSVNSLLENSVAIEGNWEGILSKSDFLKLQDSLKKNNSGYKHTKQMDYKPLSGFLRCGKCGTKMVGYINKKKNLPYYKCNYCPVSLNGNTTSHCMNTGANDLFKDLLKSYQISPLISSLLELQLKKVYQHYTGVEFDKERDFKKGIKECEERLKSLDLRLGMNEIPKSVYDITKQKLEDDLFTFRKELNIVDPKLSNLDLMVEKSLQSLENIGEMWGSLRLDDKQKFQKTLFPGGVYFDKENHTYLTQEVNSFVLISRSLSMDYVEKKNGTNHYKNEKSHSVAPTGLKSNRLMEDLRLFAQI